MKLTDTDIGQFRELWQRETGQSISDELAREYAEDVLGIVALVIEPLCKSREEKPP
jgi:hypothetical protein